MDFGFQLYCFQSHLPEYMISCKILLLAFSFLVWKPEASVRPEVSSYIDEYKYLAIDEMVRSGIPASITLAQAILESNAGVSKLARESNNHFGIKCKDYWNGSSYYHPDDDRDPNGKLIPSCFRKYESVSDSYKDHSSFLMMTEHYSLLFGYDKTEYKRWAEGLEMCGYATDCRYAEKLISTIELYDLYEYDFYTIQYIQQPIQQGTINTSQ